jgi:hypothetical protein
VTGKDAGSTDMCISCTQECTSCTGGTLHQRLRFVASVRRYVGSANFWNPNGDKAAHPGPLGIVWTAVIALVMFVLAAGTARTGAALGNPMLRSAVALAISGQVMRNRLLQRCFR